MAQTKVTPSFINIGPGRCATSWLLTALTAHPQIHMSRVKETEFFNTHFEKGTDWYEQHFESESVAVGEISNNYYLDSRVANRIRDYDSSIRLIVNVRNPFSLLQSYHRFGLRRGISLGTLVESLDSPIGQIMGSGFASRRRKNRLTPADQVSLLDSVCLADRLLPFSEVFPSEQIHFFVFERLAKDYRGTLRDLYKFLGVDAAFEPENADRVINSTVKPKSRILAQMATRSASLLRQAGAYGLLSKLHQSEWLKKLLFSRKPADQVESIRESLPKEVTSMLDKQITQLSDRYPMVAAGWKE